MTHQRFETDLARVVSEKAGWRAPANLRLRVAAVPDEFAPPSRLERMRAGAPRVVLFGAVAAAVVLLAGFAWARYEAAPPGSGPLTIETKAAPSPLPSGVGWICAQANGGPVQVVRSGSELIFISTGGSGAQIHLVWPYGFSARLVDGKGELLDPDGRVIAREGDVIARIGGGTWSDDAFEVCSVNGVEYLP